MAEKNRPAHTADAEKSKLELLLNSPARLSILGISVLVFSLMTGMIIGSFYEDDGNSYSDVSSVPEVPIGSGNTNEALENTTQSYDNGQQAAVEEPTVTGARPVDAFASKPEAGPAVTDSGVDDVSDEIVAALPRGALSDDSEKDSGQQGWRKFATPMPVLSGKPMIAMIIDDVGLSSAKTQTLISFPAPFTLAFLPYAPNLKKHTEQARAAGHELMVHIPMEPSRKTADPGPDALLEELSLDEIRRRVRKNMAQFTGYVGVNNHMGSKFTAYGAGMTVVMDELAARKLLFLDSRTTADSKGYKLARARNMLTGNRDVFIDNVQEEAAIMSQLSLVEKLAIKKGIVIVIGHPHASTIAALEKWIPTAQSKGFQFIPVSTALILRESKRTEITQNSHQ